MENTITEQDLINFGFQRHDETPESSGSEHDWYYYTLDIEDFCFITKASDDVKGGNWCVYIFDYLGFEFTTIEQIAGMINALREGIKGKK